MTLSSDAVHNETRTIEAIFELARWAPSGDNTQPWQFEFIDAGHGVIHGSDTRDHCVYDLDGRPSQMSLGALIETAAIAASVHGLQMRTARRLDTPEAHPIFDLYFTPDPEMKCDPLYEVIPQRSVQRRPFATRPLSDEQKVELQGSVGKEYAARWIESRPARLAMARLLFRSARLRLVTPEAYRVHRDVIEWNARYSADKVPDQSLGVSQAMLAMMRFAMHSWPRVRFFNRFFAGTWLPRIQMDFLPALACGAHFVLLARRPPLTLDDNVQAGRAMQRFWLTATRLGLMVQPEMTPLIFARYAQEGRSFSSHPGAPGTARRIAQGLAQVMGADVPVNGFFMGRIGHAPAPVARSLRKELSALRWNAADAV